MATETDATDRDQVREWYCHELRRLFGFTYPQRQHLADLIEHGELTLEACRHLHDKGATSEEAWWVLS